MERDVWLGGQKLGSVAEPRGMVNEPGKLVVTCRLCSHDIEFQRVDVGDYVGPAKCPGCEADLMAEAAF